MNYLLIIFIVNMIFFIINFIFFQKNNKIKIIKDSEQQLYKQNLQRQINILQKDRNDLIHTEISKKEQLHKDYIEYQNYLKEEKNRLNNDLLQWKKERQEEIRQSLINQQENIDYKIQKAKEESQQKIININEDLQLAHQAAKEQKQQIQNEIDKIKASLNAGIEARLREQQIKQKKNFYKLSINDSDLSDVKMLEDLKSSFHKPVVLSKLIWTQFFQKQMTELCDRVLGSKIKCGIYKITNILTDQCYIGQSVNIAQRWKQHCKCGLGIEASATNTLYNAMQKNGVWNYTFEMIEQCPREQLNEKESFWIDFYQSNKFGYNTQKGVLK